MDETRTELIPLKEAALRLGISVDAARRRVRAGEIPGERRKTPQGYAWWVEVPVGEDSAQATHEDASPVLEVAVLQERLAGLERLLEDVRADRDAVRADRDAWQAQAQRDSEAARELRVLLQNEQLRALPQETTPQEALRQTEADPHDVQHRAASPVPRSGLAAVWDRLRGK